jgi:hypothetical protein
MQAGESLDQFAVEAGVCGLAVLEQLWLLCFEGDHAECPSGLDLLQIVRKSDTSRQDGTDQY